MAIIPTYKVQNFLDQRSLNLFCKQLGEELWLQSNYLEKIWGYLHIRADLFSYHKENYFIDRGFSYIEKNDSKKILHLFFNFINQNSLEEQFFEKFVQLLNLKELLEDTVEKKILKIKFSASLSILDFFFEKTIYNIVRRKFIQNIDSIIDSKKQDLQINEIKNLTIKSIKKIFNLQKIKNELNISPNLFSAFILKNLNSIFENDDFSYDKLKSSIEKKLQSLNIQFSSDTNLTIEELKSFEQKFDEKLDLGQCFGLTMSLISDGCLEPENVFNKAKFLQSLHLVEHSNVANLRCKEIGKKIIKFINIIKNVAEYSEYSFLLSLVCKILNYKKPDGSIDLESFLKSDITDDIFHLIGKIAIKQLLFYSLTIREPPKNLNLTELHKIEKLYNEIIKDNCNYVSCLNLLKLKEITISNQLPIDLVTDNFNLINLKSKYIKFMLNLNSSTGKYAHDIFISLDPIGFCDQNDLNHRDLKLRFRRFDSIEDMLIHLAFLIEKLYGNSYNLFTLTTYEKR